MDNQYFRVDISYTPRDSRSSAHRLYFFIPNNTEMGIPEEYFGLVFPRAMRAIPRRSNLDKFMKRLYRGMDCCGISMLGEVTDMGGMAGARTAVWKPKRVKMPPELSATRTEIGRGAVRTYDGIRGSEWAFGNREIEDNQLTYRFSFRQSPKIFQRLSKALSRYL